MLPDNVTASPEFIFVSDLFAAQYAGGAELSLQTVMEVPKQAYWCCKLTAFKQGYGGPV